jgi:transposase
MPFVANKVSVTEKGMEILSKISKSRTLPQNQVERASIIIEASLGESNAKIAKRVGISNDVASRWRNRWIENEEFMNKIEQDNPDELEENIVYILKDATRTGAPTKFTSEQIVKILHLACQNPMDYGYEVSHWSLPKLAEVSVKEKIVESIAPSSIDRFLKDRRNSASSD